jgi:tRNA(His) guanylyltransferase
MSDNKDSLGDRMKGFENVTRFTLLRRTPTIIRLDGRAFHTFTRCLKHHDETMARTPFSIKMHNVMAMTMLGVMSQMQNAVFAYTQSDEISILLRDWDKHETEQWFSGGIQKICSVSASAASVIFNHFFAEDVRKPETYADLAQFDARVFNIPEAEVVNYFIWRQQDASRNSVQMLGRFHFSQKEMHGKNNSQVQDMLMLQKQINWNDIPTWMKRGSSGFRNPVPGSQGSEPYIVDENIPVFTADRDYVGRHLVIQSEIKE